MVKLFKFFRKGRNNLNSSMSLFEGKSLKMLRRQRCRNPNKTKISLREIVQEDLAPLEDPRRIPPGLQCPINQPLGPFGLMTRIVGGK